MKKYPPLHVAVSGWLLGDPSGANRRLLEICRHAAPLLCDDDRITVLHRADFAPPDLGAQIAWQDVAIPTSTNWSTTLRRSAAERRHLARALSACSATVLDHGLLPLPKVAVPTCFTIHDLRGVDGLTPWPRWIARMALRRACRRAAAVVVPSRFSAARLRLVAPHAEIHVVGNGVVLPPEIEPATDDASTGYLLHTGHLEHRKNIALLLHALALIPAGDRPTLLLVGRDAGEGTALRALADQLHLTERVQFRGVVADAELARLHAGARAIVVPSRYEGFGLAALDGLAFGRPTLVADAGALPEVAATAAVILSPDDPRAWAGAITGTVVDTIEQRAARRARAAAFTWPRAAAAMLEIWRAISARVS